jgi:hypothetical protein
MAAAEILTITRGIDDNVQVVNERVQIVDMKVEGINDKVRTIGSKVQSVDHKVSSVIQGELYLHSRPSNMSSAFYSARRKGDWSNDSASGRPSHRPKPFVIF